MAWFGKNTNNRSDAASPAKSSQDLKPLIADRIGLPVMTVDRDFLITYLNEASRQLFKDNLVAFRQMWPSFDPDKMIGVCIDMFHRNPQHQRRLLADPANLPFKTDITVGELKISLSVNGVFDDQRNLIGHMLEWADVTGMRTNEGMLKAIDKSQAVIEFTLDGKIVRANDNFLRALGYSMEEIRNQHHSMFVDPSFRQTDGYRQFWEKLGRGEFDAGQYKRIGKGGRVIWIQASYNPILDQNGKAFKVIKYATDITAQVEANEALQVAVRQTQHAVDAAKESDLTQRIPLEGKSGEIQSLCAGVNGLLDTMASIVSEIKGTAREVSNAAAEISTSATDLSQRTEEQAASLEETSASMEEISATVKKNAENAQQANDFAIGTRDVANRGGEVVAQAVSAMARIEESSRKISDIIGVIDEIARQTNLLALNAAVEAARAGDAGRGFAVVASEVRSLAQRSSQAAKDIKDLITHSSTQVKDGVDLVNRAGMSLNEIVNSIKKVAEIVSEIASASAEQATGLDQINKALSQMDEVTQQNSALVEENAAAAKTLEHQSGAMDERVGGFRLNNEAPAGVSRLTPASAPKRPAAKPAAAPKRGPVGRMQTALATALDADSEWKEF